MDRFTRSREPRSAAGRRSTECTSVRGGTSIAAEPSIGRATEVEASQSPAAEQVAGLYDRHGHRILAYCRSRLRDREDAEDAAQTTFLLAQRALDRGVEPREEATWLVTIAQNVCLNRFRDSRRVREAEIASAPDELERLGGAVPEPVDLEVLKEALAGLPEPQRRAILLREFQGWSYAEIERELGLGKAAVETLIFRGRRALATQLQGKLRAFDAASLLSALKGMLGGGAAKLAAGAAAVAVVGTGIAVQAPGPQKPQRPPAPSAAAVSSVRSAPAEAGALRDTIPAAGPTDPAQPARMAALAPPPRPSAPTVPAAAERDRPGDSSRPEGDNPRSEIPAERAAQTDRTGDRPPPKRTSTPAAPAPVPATVAPAPEPVEVATPSVTPVALPPKVAETVETTVEEVEETVTAVTETASEAVETVTGTVETTAKTAETVVTTAKAPLPVETPPLPPAPPPPKFPLLP